MKVVEHAVFLLPQSERLADFWRVEMKAYTTTYHAMALRIKACRKMQTLELLVASLPPDSLRLNYAKITSRFAIAVELLALPGTLCAVTTYFPRYFLSTWRETISHFGCQRDHYATLADERRRR